MIFISYTKGLLVIYLEFNPAFLCKFSTLENFESVLLKMLITFGGKRYNRMKEKSRMEKENIEKLRLEKVKEKRKTNLFDKEFILDYMSQ